MSEPSNIDQTVQEILSDMSLKEKAAIANIDGNFGDVVYKLYLYIINICI